MMEIMDKGLTIAKIGADSFSKNNQKLILSICPIG